MYNPHIEGLVFAAETLDHTPIHLRFHEIARVNTRDNLFYFDDGFHDPVPCRYDSLRLLEPEAVAEARLKAMA